MAYTAELLLNIHAGLKEKHDSRSVKYTEESDSQTLAFSTSGKMDCFRNANVKA